MKPNQIWAIASLLLAAMFSTQADAEISRADFAKAMGTVRPGMSEEQVVAALGKPDDIRNRFDPRGITTPRTLETWAYGTDGHLSFPTLGFVYMKEGKVKSIYGGKGTPPDPAMFSEANLKTILRQIDKASEHNPLSLIQAVNCLQPLGKDKALAAMSEYLRVTNPFGDSQRIPLFLVLRLLFEVPEDTGFMPRMLVGSPNPPEPKEPLLLPLFPLALQDDIPLYLVYGYALAGMAQPVEEHVEYFRKNGKLRAHPLQPTSDPLAVLAKIEVSPQWLVYRDLQLGFTEEHCKGYLADQLLRLVDSVYRLEPGESGGWFGGDHFDQQRWDGVVKDFAAMHVKWDATKNIYVFADGTSLPEIKKPYYLRNIWDLTALGPNTSLIIERTDKGHLHFTLQRTFPQERATAACVVRLYCPDENKQQLAEFNLPAASATNALGSESHFHDAELPEGKAVQAELIYEGKSTTSPVFAP